MFLSVLDKALNLLLKDLLDLRLTSKLLLGDTTATRESVICLIRGIVFIIDVLVRFLVLSTATRPSDLMLL